MNQSITKWVIVADAANARIFEVEEGGKLKLLQKIDNPAGRARPQDLVTDGPGRLEKGMGRNVLSAMEPRTTLHEAEMQNFALELSRVLHDAAQGKRFGSLAIAAPPHFLGLLRQKLDPAVAHLVVKTVDKDFAHLAEHELQPHLAGMFQTG